MDFSSKYVFNNKKRSNNQPSIQSIQQPQLQTHQIEPVIIPNQLAPINESIDLSSSRNRNSTNRLLFDRTPPKFGFAGNRPLISTIMASSASNRPLTSGGSALKKLLNDDEEPDTNVVRIKFDKLKDPSTMQAGDATKCQNCDAYISNISKIENNNELTMDFHNDEKLWKCDFCNMENKLQIDNEEIPKIDDVTYILEPAPGIINATTSQEIHSEYVIYCIDVSGSMSVTTKVNGNLRLPTDEIRRQKAQEISGEPVFIQRIYHERYVSRLEAVQVALCENIKKLVKETPNKKVGLVTFNHEVHSFGDGSIDEIVISGDYLNKKENIIEKANLTGEFKPIQESKNFLNDKIIGLEEGGSTALGPALYYSILIASRRPGSKVILCTDGLANKGIGSLDNNDDQSAFYNELSTLATSKGVSVSMITIKGTDCKLGLLADITDKTGGLVNIVDPLNIVNEFTSILEDQIIATNVVAKFLVHRALYIRDYENENNQQSVVSKTIGNATLETEITFEFAIKENFDEQNLNEVPFQLQIVYTAKDGSKALRILTQMKPLTNDKNLAEAEADRTVLAQHFVQSNSRLIQQGPKQRSLYKMRAEKWDGYLKNKFLQTVATGSSPRNDDGFSETAYFSAVKDMSHVIDQTDCLMKSECNLKLDNNNKNMFSEMSDEAATKGYKLSNFNSKFLKKK